MSVTPQDRLTLVKVPPEAIQNSSVQLVTPEKAIRGWREETPAREGGLFKTAREDEPNDAENPSDLADCIDHLINEQHPDKGGFTKEKISLDLTKNARLTAALPK